MFVDPLLGGVGVGFYSIKDANFEFIIIAL